METSLSIIKYFPHFLRILRNKALKSSHQCQRFYLSDATRIKNVQCTAYHFLSSSSLIIITIHDIRNTMMMMVHEGVNALHPSSVNSTSMNTMAILSMTSVVPSSVQTAVISDWQGRTREYQTVTSSYIIHFSLLFMNITVEFFTARNNNGSPVIVMIILPAV